MSEPIIPIPDDIRHHVLELWGPDVYDQAMSACQVLLHGDSIGMCIAAGRVKEVRQMLAQLSDGTYA